MRTSDSLLLLALLSIVPAAVAQQPVPVLVKDLNTEPVLDEGSHPHDWVEFGKDIYFAAYTNGLGTELYRSTQGTTKASLVKDIVPGYQSSAPQGMVVFKDAIYFAANGGELWKTDGTAIGTVLVQKVTKVLIMRLTVVGKKLFFVWESSDKIGIGVSDGTGQGTVRIGPTRNRAWVPRELIASGETLFFSWEELWKSDGTSAGTVMVKDLYPGKNILGMNNASWPRKMIALGDKVIFAANVPPYENSHWVSDGEAKGTILLEDIDGFPSPWGVGTVTPNRVRLGDKIYFGALEGQVGTSLRWGLWETGGTPASTKRIKSVLGHIGALTVVGDKIFFFNHHEKVRELWCSDKTGPGTLKLGSFPKHLHIIKEEMAALGNMVLFAAESSGSGVELWRSDGTVNGTAKVAEIAPGTTGSFPQTFKVTSSGQTVFSADDGVLGHEQWVSDGTTGETQLVSDVKPPGPTHSSNISQIIDHHGMLLFSLDDELWTTDGTSAKTRKVTAVKMGVGGFLGADLISHGSVGTNTGILKTDGTAAGTSLIRSGVPASHFIGRIGGDSYLASISSPLELWKTDGTAGGTWRVASIPGALTGFDRPPVTCYDRLYFISKDSGGAVKDLYCSDGTKEGTVRIDPAQAPTSFSSPYQLFVLGGEVYFFALTSGTNPGLFETDGTAQGTVLKAPLKAVSPATSGVVLGASYFYSGLSTKAGQELWCTDGTAAGSHMVKDINPSSGFIHSEHITKITRVGRKFFFVADDGKAGVSLWKSDGTESGTVLVKSVLPGAGPGRAQYDNFTAVGEKVFFTADDGVHGMEPWRSDGTAQGTQMVADLYLGGEGSMPGLFCLSGGKLYFTADNGFHGSELWMLEPGTHAQVLGSACTQGGPLTLDATSPALASTLTIGLSQQATKSGTVGLFALGIALGRPYYLGRGCTLYVDLTRPHVLLPFAPDKVGRWSFMMQVPNLPILNGMIMPIQASVGLANGSAAAAELTNGVLLVPRK